VFLTVCTRRREKVLANDTAHQTLVTGWQSADAWLVGHYVIMPDHIHLFCTVQNEDHSLQDWVTYWKRQLKRALGLAAPALQPHSFHHRLRQEEDYNEKWQYVRDNPVRAGLAKHAEDWPFQGCLNELRW